MIHNKKVIVVLPAFNAAKTLKKTYDDIPFDIVDDVIIVDDFSSDDTQQIARSLGIKNIYQHSLNKGYGANQKTCYNEALKQNADIIVMLHPDYQYTPKLIAAMVSLLANDVYDVVIGSRILGKGALRGGMPLYKYISNRILTLFQNLLMNQKLSEYHTGYRAYKKDIFEKINFNSNSDDFVFDNEFLSQILFHGFQVGEISCPTKYFDDASSINFRRSIQYGLGVLRVSVLYFLAKTKIYNSTKFNRIV